MLALVLALVLIHHIAMCCCLSFTLPMHPLYAYLPCTPLLLTYHQRFGDVSFIHRDGPSEHVTALLYPNEEWSPEYQGETIFFDEEGHLREAVLPKPGRCS